ncbi:hypothetical protein PR003_g21568 [Phytophthora rubi]|uniref:Uncharacterized protein n=1 Tax=Phytophthora rubi TaxID=129364 RepID=A0A6A3JCF8_9STRA|nr:hypothetical protein PR002_g21332 [Phytophthora rubi]KAE8992373.1 hypothetical protein PR001_g20959 [Phytophthora rubi]KAE9305186.1 hypothetical protein PR003_g21568 [Phytophthora rubi]
MPTETTEATDQGSLIPRDPVDQEDCSMLCQPFQRKPKRFKKDGTPYKPRKGWGPYRSVPNERAAAFNLQLDVQALQQEIRNLTALRDVLRTKPMIQRHSPEGSLMQVVKEYFRVFRTGLVSNISGVIPRMTAEQQCDFLYGIVDAEVDVGNGLRGPDIMMYQLDMYSTLLRWIRLEMHSFDIVEAEDSVIIKASTTFSFQAVRETIKMIFPLVIGEGWLVSQLVGKAVDANMDITFYFNAEGKCSKMVVDTDFVGAFANIVTDLESVNILLSQALIADNSMLGVIEEPPEVDTTAQVPAAMNGTRDHGKAGSFVKAGRSLRSASYHDQAENVESLANGMTTLTSQSSQPPRYPYIPKPCVQTVGDYYLAFRNGFQTEDSEEATKLSIAFQRDFLLHRFVSWTACANCTSAEYVEKRWRSLSKCFSVLDFHQKSVVSVEIHQHVGTCMISSSARYTLRLTPGTLLSVFPHIEDDSQLYGALVGEIVTVPSQIYFSVGIETGRIYRLEEQMDFAVGMANIIASRQELDLVLLGANLTPAGVSF